MNKQALIGLTLMLTINHSWSDTVTTVATGFSGSGDLLVGNDGDIYNANFGARLSNSNGSTIVRISPDGQVNAFASGFQGASGMALDSAGNIIQANITGSFISRVTPNGTVTTIASQGFSSPVGVAVNSSDQIFVANCGNNSISRIDNGVGVNFISSSLLQCPNGLTVDDEDNLYAVNFNNGLVTKIDPQGNISELANSGGGNGHIVFGNNRLYFTNHVMGQVFELSLEGELKVLAGTGVMGHQNGDALSATFTGLNGIGISQDGKTIYVNEPAAIGSALTVNLNPNILRAIQLEETTNNDFVINSGLAGSWYNPSQDGQGVVFDFAVGPERFDAVMYWFTYNDEPSDTDTELSGFGSRQSRWFTAIGPVTDGALLELTTYRTSAGVFNDSTPVDITPVGVATVEFSSCFEATLTYEFTEPEAQSGSIALQRITPDIYCETLDEAKN